MSITRLSLQNSVLVNMLMVTVMVFGLVALFMLPREEYPPVDFGATIISVVYPGVSPSEIETLVLKKIEDQISDTDGIDYMEGTAEEGRALIIVRFLPGVDPDKAWNDINTEMDKVTDLPDDAQDPMVIRLNMREVNAICQVVLGGDFDQGHLRDIADDMEDGLLNLSNVSKVEINGARDRQIWVDADTRKLEACGLTLSDLQNALNGRNLNLPGGTATLGKIEFLVRTMGEYKNVTELGDTEMQLGTDGSVVRIKDVATVRDTLEKAQTISRLNGKQSISLMVYKKGDGNIIKVMKNVRSYVDDFSKNIPGLSAEVRNDGSIDVNNAMRSLGSNALQGIILVFVVLLIFIGWRNALLAAWGIPFSIFFTFMFMDFYGTTLNNLSLFGLIIVIGMIVDNAIVVLENTHRHRELGLGLYEAIVKGADEVRWPIIASTLTTICAFLPMLMMQGMMGKFLSIFPVIVSVALAGSLIESMIILPAHINSFAGDMSEKAITVKLTTIFTKYYRRILRFALHRRFWVLGAIVVLFLGSFVALGLNLIKQEFFPSTTSQTISLELQTPVGTTLEETSRLVGHIEDYIHNIPQKDDIEAVVANVGVIGEEGRQDIKTSNAQVSIDLVDLDKMKYTHDEIKSQIRSYLENLPGLYTYKFNSSQHGPPVGNDVEIRVKGDNLDKLSEIGDYLKDILKDIPGVTDIEDSFEEGKNEIRIHPYFDRLKYHGISNSQLAVYVRTALNGTETGTYREGTDEYDIIVRAQDRYTHNVDNLKNLKIKSNRGYLVPLSELASFETAQGLAKLTHRDKQRTITVTASVAPYMDNGKMRKRTSPEVVAYLMGNQFTGTKGKLSDFGQRYPGYIMEFGGSQQEQSKSYNSLYRAFLIALLLIFTILAAQFRSYVQPLIVMITIPFAFIGVIIGLLVTGLPFSLTALISVVALAGVVVNNSLILVDFINRGREEGLDRWHAIINAGSVRLRPILLTTVTTVSGMLPLVFSTSTASQGLRPLAVTFTFGLLFSTVLTLFVIPIIYSVVDSIFGRIKGGRFKEHTSFEEAFKALED